MDCFISYSTDDAAVAHLLKGLLERREVRVFLAEDSIPPGTDWGHLIQTTLKRCEAVVLLDSEASRASAYVQQEVGIALASGGWLIPISLDGRLDRLPGWLDDIQAIRLFPNESPELGLARVADEVCVRLGPALLPTDLRNPNSAGVSVLKTVLMDQFSGPAERAGAWSRQYDRYLRLYYAGRNLRSTISQGQTLTFTGMIAERLSKYALSATGPTVQFAEAALANSGVFVLSSQDQLRGGFGRHSGVDRVRDGAAMVLDLRHTCWAIRALLSISPERYEPQIGNALRWLAAQADVRNDSDRWCWTTAPLLALLLDPRLQDIQHWRRTRESLKATIEFELAENFDPKWNSWVRTEDETKRSWVSIDNALYVLYCLKDCEGISQELDNQRSAAIEGLLSRSVAVSNQVPACGIPLFDPNRPEAGPSAQLVEIIDGRPKYAGQMARLENYIVSALSAKSVLSQTFPWHISSVLTNPRLRDRSILGAG